MTKFRFPLQKVLEWRRMQMELEEAKLQQQFAVISELDRARAQLEAAAIAAEIEVRERVSLQGSDLATLGDFRRHVRTSEQRLLARRQACATELETQRQKMLEARRRFRLLERLRGRRLDEWQVEVDHESENFAAEAHLARLVREGSLRAEEEDRDRI
jgi:hypothetical protein